MIIRTIACKGVGFSIVNSTPLFNDHYKGKELNIFIQLGFVGFSIGVLFDTFVNFNLND